MNASARILFFKAEQLGLFGVSTPVKGYVSKKTGKRIAPLPAFATKPSKSPSIP